MEIRMKKPIVVWVLQVALALISIAYGILAIGSVVGMANGAYSIVQGGGGILVGAVILGRAVLLLVKVARQATTRRSISVFLCVVLVVYPISNVLSGYGFFPPRTPIEANQLVGAAIVELARYIGLLVLLAWLSFSSAAARFLSARNDAEESLNR